MQANSPGGVGLPHAEFSGGDTAQLEAWAYGRHESQADSARAAAALSELARRAEAARVAATATDNESRDRPAGASPSAESEPAKRSRVKRLTIALLTSIVLAAIVAVALLITAPRGVGALTVFDGERSTLETLLGGQLEGVGQRVGAGPSILVESDMATVVAYLSNSRAAGPLDLVCLAVIEPHGVGDWSCIDYDDFVESGIEALLYGLLGLYSIDWSAQGDLIARMPGAFEVGPSGSASVRGDYRDVLFVEQSEVDREVGRVLGALDVTLGAGPVVVVPIVDLEGAPADDLGVIAAWSAISPDPQTGVIVCLGIIDLPTPASNDGSVRTAECVSDEQMSTDGLRLEASFGTRTTVLSWDNETGIRGSATDR